MQRLTCASVKSYGDHCHVNFDEETLLRRRFHRSVQAKYYLIKKKSVLLKRKLKTQAAQRT